MKFTNSEYSDDEIAIKIGQLYVQYHNESKCIFLKIQEIRNMEEKKAYEG